MLNLAAMYDYRTKFSTLQLYPIYPVLNLVKGTSTYPTAVLPDTKFIAQVPGYEYPTLSTRY